MNQTVTETLTEILSMVSARQLDHWVRRGWLHPDDPAPGSGNTRQWSDGEWQAARMMAKLVNAGLTPQAASKVAHGQLLLAPGVWVVVNP